MDTGKVDQLLQHSAGPAEELVEEALQMPHTTANNFGF